MPFINIWPLLMVWGLLANKAIIESLLIFPLSSPTLAPSAVDVSVLNAGLGSDSDGVDLFTDAEQIGPKSLPGNCTEAWILVTH